MQAEILPSPSVVFQLDRFFSLAVIFILFYFSKELALFGYECFLVSMLCSCITSKVVA